MAASDPPPSDLGEAEDAATSNAQPEADESSQSAASDATERTAFDAAEFTDSRLSKQLAAELAAGGTPFVWVVGVGWHKWTGERWQTTGEEIVKGVLKDHLLAWFDAEVHAGVTDDRRAAISKTLSDSRQKALLSSLKAEVAQEAGDFDARPDLLNVRNGVVDLQSGELHPHDPALHLTKITSVNYKPGATHRDWTRTLKALPDVERDYLLARLGQAITGHAPNDDRVTFLDGPGGNGKTTVTDAVRFALGGYAGMVPQQLLVAKNDAHPTEQMTLRGVRFAQIEELPEAGRLNTQRLKTITGTGEIAARLMRENFVSFEPCHSLFVTTNHLPAIQETDHGTWRRLERVPFRRNFRKGAGVDSVDTTLRQRVRSDPAVREAVLATLVEHARRWYANGRKLPEPPESIRAAVDEWRGRSDVLRSYFEERLEVSPGSIVSSTELLEDLNAWLASDRGDQTGWTADTLAARLQSHEGLPVRLEKDRRRLTSDRGYSRRPGAFAPVPKGPAMCWVGVRFRSSE